MESYLFNSSLEDNAVLIPQKSFSDDKNNNNNNSMMYAVCIMIKSNHESITYNAFLERGRPAVMSSSNERFVR